jgi:hypothetical protein
MISDRDIWAPLRRGRAPKFKCYHCGGSTFRVLDRPKVPPTVECLSCGRSSQFDRRGSGRTIDPQPKSDTDRA